MSTGAHWFRNWGRALLLISPGLAAGDQLPFGPDSLGQIEREYAGEPFLLVLWSADCFPCRKELATLGAITRTNPDLNLVLLATDDIVDKAMLGAILEQHGLAHMASWIFAHPNVERLRYSVDPQWYGELPRSYFYDADAGRRGISGPLAAEAVEAWLSSQRSADQSL